MNKRILEQIKSERALKAQTAKPNLSYHRHIVRKRGSLATTITLEEIKGSRKEEGQI